MERRGTMAASAIPRIEPRGAPAADLLNDMERLLLAFADAPPHPPCSRPACVLCARAPGRGERVYLLMKTLSAELRRRPDFTPGREVVAYRRRS
jgi:hypothetical protein